MNYYNENDKFAAAWLRLLIQEKQIADGEVDERSIEEVQPEDLVGFTQCHFFAGIGIWSYALRCAGWPDDRPVWTGSCPCPSFSAAGQGKGFDDPRHLWPAWSRLIRECKPATIFGEQVDDAIGFGWLDVVQTELEKEAYAVGKAVFGACSVGAPQIGQRLYFVAQTNSDRTQRSRRHQLITNAGCEIGSVAASEHAIGRTLNGEHGRNRSDAGRQETHSEPRTCSEVCSVAASDGGNASAEGLQRSGEHGQRPQDGGTGELGASEDRGFGMCGSASGSSGRPAQPESTGVVGSPERTRLERHSGNGDDRNEPRRLDAEPDRSIAAAGPTNGFWADAEWLYCTDGKYRPVEPGTFPLAHGYPNRVGTLRGYGNAICAPQAEEFVKAYLEIFK